MTATGKTAPPRPVRSYVIRSGRLTTGQRRAIQQYSSKFVIEFEPKALDVRQIFRVDQPLTVEVGFGSGDSLLQMAREQPRANFLGIDVYESGIGRTLQGIVEHELRNLRLMHHDAVEVFEVNLEAESVDRVLMLFPDPWPRKRHHKRRLVQEEFMNLVLTRLKPGGTVHLATDWPPYLEHMMRVMRRIPGFSNCFGENACWENPERPLTRFELRGRRLGHEVRDLLYRKTGT